MTVGDLLDILKEIEGLEEHLRVKNLLKDSDAEAFWHLENRLRQLKDKELSQ